MNLTVSLEQRFLRTPDGAIWTPAAFRYQFWMRYLEVFDMVRIVARVCDVADAPPNHWRVDGAAVALAALPYYVGPLEYLTKLRSLRRALYSAVDDANALILRIPSPIAAQLLEYVGDRPYGVEVVGDPWDVFAPGAVTHPLRPVFRRWFAYQMRHQCAGACAAAYVTREALQRRYPPERASYSTACSDVELPSEAFAPVPREPLSSLPQFRLVYVGSLAQLYKAPDVLLEAMARCVAAGLDLRLDMVGDGKYRDQLQQQAEHLGIADRVIWHGIVSSGVAVRERLDAADLFVLPSRTEGLPRAMIEAMARGLPCIGSTVGGMPELLPAEDLVAPGDAQALAAAILSVARSPARMAEMSARNLAVAREYADEILRERRLAFYQAVREQTECWQRMRAGHAPQGVTHGALPDRRNP